MKQVIKNKTSGLQWLALSFASFNGSGYGDMSTPEEFVQSYTDYKSWKGDTEAVRLAEEYGEELYNMAHHIIHTSHGAGMTPSPKQLAKFNEYKNSRQL